MALSDAASWTVPMTAVHELEHAERTWRVSVARPLTPPVDGRCRVLYVLDPLGTFGTAVHITRSLELLCQGSLPPVLVVGVGPATDDLAEVLAVRYRDLTPCDAAANEAEGLAAAGLTCGGADEFLSVLLDVIAPEVEAQYDADSSDRTLAGWSLGGLAAAHALVTRPNDVRRYLLVSPSLWWAEAEILQRVGSLADVAAPLDVYISSAEHEQSDVDRIWPPLPQGPVRDAVATQVAANAMTTNVQELARRLRGLDLPALSVHDEVLAGEHHNTTWAAAFTRGLLALHADSYRLGS